jgi:hypothetical protein
VDPHAPIGAGVGVGTGVGVPRTDDASFDVVWCGTPHWWGAGRARRVG